MRRLYDCFIGFFFLMIRRPPRSTLDRSSAASDVYKRQDVNVSYQSRVIGQKNAVVDLRRDAAKASDDGHEAVSYTHLRAHETVLDLVCRLLLEKKKHTQIDTYIDPILH